MKKPHLLGAACAASLAVLSTQAHAALVTEILGLDIGGTRYDVTFHSQASFQNLWDADGDWVFGDGDGATFNNAPTFWNNAAAAYLAATAIMNALGSSDITLEADTNPDLPRPESDSFMVPYEQLDLSKGLYVGLWQDQYEPGSDGIYSNGNLPINSASLNYAPYASFSASVPVPAAAWLFGSGLLGLIGISRRKKSA